MMIFVLYCSSVFSVVRFQENSKMPKHKKTALLPFLLLKKSVCERQCVEKNCERCGS